MNRTTRRLIAVVSLALALPAATCDAPDIGPIPPPPAAALGRVVATSGPNATIDGGPARPGQPIGAGQQFRTGPATTMEIALRNGGSVFLDPDTDPSLRDAACLIITTFHFGHIYVDGHDICVQTTTGLYTQQSQVDYLVRGATTQITVYSGQVIVRRPPGYVIAAGQRMVFNGVVPTRPPFAVSPQELARMAAALPPRLRARIQFPPQRPVVVGP